HETGMTAEALAEGFIDIAVENMAQAIKKVSVQSGHNVSAYTLTCFGGAGGQHACRVADVLGIKRTFFHRFSGVLSAYGMGLAAIRANRERAIEKNFESAALPHIEKTYADLKKEIETEFAAQA